MKTSVSSSIGWGGGELTCPPCLSARMRGVLVPRVPEQDMPPGAAQARGQWDLPGSSQLPGEVPVSSPAGTYLAVSRGKMCVVGAGLSPEGYGKPLKGLCCTTAAQKEDASGVGGSQAKPQ